MSKSDLAPRMAHEIRRGHGVKHPGGKIPDAVFLKAERQGADYIHHYLIQLSPLATSDLALIYIDPDEVLLDTGAAPLFDYSHGEARQDPDVGDIFENIHGVYLKVIEDPKSQKMFAYIDIANGEIKRRQERRVKTVYTAWRAIDCV